MCLAALLTASANPARQVLHDNWQFRQARLNNWYPATVPGVVHTDLMRNQLLEDPFFRLNERGAQWVDKEDWIYESHFDATPEVFDKEHVELVFEGLDTYADVYLNDSLVLHADNMFRRWRVDIKPLLQSVNNRLKVYFSSPIKVDMPKYEALPYRYEACNDQSANGGLLDRQISIFARKAGYHYGWDWGPRLVTSGIWRPVYLDAWSECRINDVFYNQRNITPERAELSVEIEIQTSHAVPAACVEVRADKESVCVEKTVALQA
ncbi:MAG: glycoside hydrolase family 2 protein, partial [Alistipes sp.]